MASDSSGPKLCTTCGARHPADALFCATDGTPLVAAGSTQAQRTSDPSADPYVGRELAGHIEVRQLAGVGAMGRVYRAFQKGIDRDVAVKILHRELSANPQLVARFHREAKVASRLLHPNVVQVHLAGQLPDGALYIVMEYLDGLSLQSALAAAGGALPLPRALHVALQICDAVGEAHAQSIVHRDLKPENVMLVHRGEDSDFVKVLDFGIARLDWGEQSMATAAGLIFGTARYISPEGAQGEQVTPHGDVYALATMTYQMLAGRTPFEGEQAVGLLVQQIHDAPPPLRSIPRAAYVPEPIANALMANLAKDRAQRAPDARTLGRQLLDAAKASGLSADDLVPRSILLGARVSGSVQLPSMQRTRQLQLDRPIDDLLREAPQHTEIATNEPLRTAYEQPADGPVAPSPTAAATRVLGTPPTPEPARMSVTSAPGGATQKVAPASNVTVQLAPATNVTAQLAGLAIAIPRAPISSVDMTMDESSAPISVPRGPSYVSHAPTPIPSPAIHEGRRAPLPPTAFDESLDDAPEEPRGPPWNRIAIVLLFFLVGIGLTTAVARGLHMIGPATSATVSADDVATPEPVRGRDALGRTQPAPAPLLVLPSFDAGTRAPSGRATVTASGAFRTTLDAFPAHPRLGQEVDLVVKVTTLSGAALKKPITEPYFAISGTGIGGEPAKLPAFDDGTGLLRASFTFLAAGKYEIAFHAKSDSMAIHATRLLVAQEAAQPAPAPQPAASVAPSEPAPAEAQPAPSGSVKWL